MGLEDATDGLRWAIFGSLVPVGVAAVLASVFQSVGSGSQIASLVAMGILAPPTLMMALAAYGAVAARKMNFGMAAFGVLVILELLFLVLGFLPETYAADLDRDALFWWNCCAYGCTVVACSTLEVRRVRRR